MDDFLNSPAAQRLVEFPELIESTLCDSCESKAEQVRLLIAVASILQGSWERERSLEDLDRAIATLERAFAISSPDHAYHSKCAAILYSIHLSRYQSFGSADDLGEAFRYIGTALDTTLENDPLRIAYLCDLGLLLLLKFERMGSIEDLKEAIHLTEVFIQDTITVGNKKVRNWALNNLGLLYHHLFGRTRSMEDFQRAMTAIQMAVNEVPEGSPLEAPCRINLGVLLITKFEHDECVDDLHKAITMLQDVIDSKGSNDIIGVLSLCRALCFRFEISRASADLERSVACLELLQDAIARGHPHSRRILLVLSMVFRSRFEITRAIEDLDQAVQFGEKAVNSLKVDHPDTPGAILSLLAILVTRYRWNGSLPDLDRADKLAASVVELTTDKNPIRGRMWSICCPLLLSRYRCSGLMSDLDNAIQCGIAAAQLNVGASGSPRGLDLCNLASGFYQRGEVTNSLDDLDRGVVLARASLSVTPVNDQRRLDIFSILACALLCRMTRTKSFEDGQEGLATMKELIKYTPSKDIRLASFLSNFAYGVRVNIETFGESFMEYLDLAIAAIKEALTMISCDNSDYARVQFNLSYLLNRRFKAHGQVSDLEEAILTSERALELLVVDHPDRAQHLIILGGCLWDQWMMDGSEQVKEKALRAFESAVEVPTAISRIRVVAAKNIFGLAAEDPLRVSHPLKVALKLLPTISPRTLSRKDQQFNITDFRGFASDAAAAALESNASPYEALHLLEQGRGVMATFPLEIRSDISILEEAHPELAREFTGIRNALDSTLVFEMSSKENEVLDSRRRLLWKFDDLLKRIRALNGLDRFLLGASEREMEKLAEFGSVVLFNVSRYRSDAFIVTQQGIHCLPLPLINPSDLEIYAEQFIESIQSAQLRSYPQAKSSVKKVLEWLWDVAVGPVLDHLQLTKTPGEGDIWPRVWWIGCGLLSILPIHAAGYHEANDSRNVIDRVISSYSPTLKALAFAREFREKGKTQLHQNFMLVGMPTTPRQKDLPFVHTELDEIQKLLAASTQTTIMMNPTRSEVLSVFPDQQIVHLSCHGNVSLVDPSKSALLLEDWQTAPLSVSDLIASKIQAPQLAYLSACHSATTQEMQLLDESINLAAAFQLAGFPSVVGTLWQVTDLFSAVVAKNVYKWMVDGTGKLDFRRSSEGVHNAIRLLREQTRCVPEFSRRVADDPLIWAAYVHFGV